MRSHRTDAARPSKPNVVQLRALRSGPTTEIRPLVSPPESLDDTELRRSETPWIMRLTRA